MIRVHLKVFVTQAVIHAINQFHDGWSLSDSINDLDEDFEIRNLLANKYFGYGFDKVISEVKSTKIKDFIDELYELFAKKQLIHKNIVNISHTHILYNHLKQFAVKDYSINIGDLFKHCKGLFYLILMLSDNSENPGEELVTYQNIETGEVWTRPRKMFEEKHSSGKPRFVRIKPSEIPNNLKLANTLFKIQNSKKVKELFSFYERKNRNQYRMDMLKIVIKPGDSFRCITTINNRLVPGCKCKVKEMSCKYPNKIVIETEYSTIQAIDLLYLKPFNGEVSFRNMSDTEFDEFIDSFAKS